MAKLDGDLMLQLGAFAPHATLFYEQHGLVRTGTSAGGIFPNSRLQPWPETDGWSVDVVPGLIVNATRGMDVDLAARIPLRGEDTLVFFPIEDLSPTLGNTYSATLRFRY
jgi:hypothetical protein